MTRVQLSATLPIELFEAISRQANIEGKATTRWMIDVCKDRLRAMGKLPEELTPVADRDKVRALFDDHKILEDDLTPARQRQEADTEILRRIIDQET